jgi:hypothetical protein
MPSRRIGRWGAWTNERRTVESTPAKWPIGALAQLSSTQRPVPKSFQVQSRLVPPRRDVSGTASTNNSPSYIELLQQKAAMLLQLPVPGLATTKIDRQ